MQFLGKLPSEIACATINILPLLIKTLSFLVFIIHQRDNYRPFFDKIKNYGFFRPKGF